MFIGNQSNKCSRQKCRWMEIMIGADGSNKVPIDEEYLGWLYEMGSLALYQLKLIAYSAYGNIAPTTTDWR